MAEKDKISKLNEEKAEWENRRTGLDEKTTKLNAEISGLQNRQTALAGDRANLQQEYQALKERPHENLERLMKTQDGIAATDGELAKTNDALEGADRQYQTAIREQIDADNRIQGLQSKIDDTVKIQEWQSNIENTLKTGAEKAEPYVEPSLEVAVHLADHAFHWGIVPGIDHQLQRDAIEGAKVTWDYVGAQDSLKIENEKLQHSQQLAELDGLKGQIASQMAAEKAELVKTMGTDLKDWDPKAQKEFHHNQYSDAFHKADQLRAEQGQERANLYANNTALRPDMLVTQVENRTAMHQEWHAHHYEMTRDLAAGQATLNVELSNAEMTQLNQARLESQNAPEDRMQTQMEALKRVQQEQFMGDVYRQTNEIHSQNCPELSQQPPEINAPAVTAPTPPAQAGPGDGPPPPGM